MIEHRVEDDEVRPEVVQGKQGLDTLVLVCDKGELVSSAPDSSP
jgi:hypothetical protein